MIERALECALLAVLLFGDMIIMAACVGPSKARYRVLLEECRAHEREYVRILKESEKTFPILPEQVFGSVGFGEGGH